jgi:hypothetical protein
MHSSVHESLDFTTLSISKESLNVILSPFFLFTFLYIITIVFCCLILVVFQTSILDAKGDPPAIIWKLPMPGKPP